MFFGETPTFEEIITLASDFEKTFNATVNPAPAPEISSQ